MPPQVAWRVSRRHLKTWVGTRFICNDIFNANALWCLCRYLLLLTVSQKLKDRVQQVCMSIMVTVTIWERHYLPMLKYWCLSRKHDKHSCNLQYMDSIWQRLSQTKNLTNLLSPCWKEPVLNLRWLKPRLLNMMLNGMIDWIHKYIGTIQKEKTTTST